MVLGSVKRDWLRVVDAQGPAPKVSRKGGFESTCTDLEPGDTRGAIGELQAVKQGRFGLVDDPTPHNIEGFAAPAKKGHHPLPSSEA